MVDSADAKALGQLTHLHRGAIVDRIEDQSPSFGCVHRLSSPTDLSNLYHNYA